MVFSVQEDFDEFGSIDLDLGSLANDFGGVDQVTEDGFVYRGEGSGAGTHLLDSGVAGGLLEDAALGDEEDVTVRQFLFEFAGEADLDLAENLELGDREEDDDSLLSVGHVDLLNRQDSRWYREQRCA